MVVASGREWVLRRAVTIPVYLAAFVFVVVATPVAVPALIAVDLIRRSRLALARAWLFGLAYFSCEAAGIVAAGWIWLRYRQEERSYLRHNADLQRRWAQFLLRATRWLYRIELVVEGQSCMERGPFLLLVRHVSPIDNLLPAALLRGEGTLVPRYVINRMLLRDPCVDIVANRLGSAFVRAGSEGSLQDIRKVASLARDLGPNRVVVIFPEGALYTPARHAEAIAALREGRDPVLAEIAARFRRVLPPHLGGTFALLNAAEGVDVVFCAHAGLELAASYRSIAAGDPVGTTLKVKFWRVPARDIPRGRAERSRWLLEEWAKVDRWVAEVGDGPQPELTALDTPAGGG